VAASISGGKYHRIDGVSRKCGRDRGSQKKIIRKCGGISGINGQRNGGITEAKTK